MKWSGRAFPKCPATHFRVAACEKGFLDTGGLIMTWCWQQAKARRCQLAQYWVLKGVIPLFAKSPSGTDHTTSSTCFPGPETEAENDLAERHTQWTDTSSVQRNTWMLVYWLKPKTPWYRSAASYDMHQVSPLTQIGSGHQPGTLVPTPVLWCTEQQFSCWKTLLKIKEWCEVAVSAAARPGAAGPFRCGFAHSKQWRVGILMHIVLHRFVLALLSSCNFNTHFSYNKIIILLQQDNNNYFTWRHLMCSKLYTSVQYAMF